MYHVSKYLRMRIFGACEISLAALLLAFLELSGKINRVRSI